MVLYGKKNLHKRIKKLIMGIFYLFLPSLIKKRMREEDLNAIESSLASIGSQLKGLSGNLATLNKIFYIRRGKNLKEY